MISTYLLQESMDALNKLLKEPISANRFRPKYPLFIISLFQIWISSNLVFELLAICGTYMRELIWNPLACEGGQATQNLFRQVGPILALLHLLPELLGIRTTRFLGTSIHLFHPCTLHCLVLEPITSIRANTNN